MTVKELSQLYWLTKEIAKYEERLEELQDKANSPSSPNYGDKIQSSFSESKLEKICCEIADLSAIIAAKKVQCIHEENRLQRYIFGIEDSLTRQIFTARFIDGCTWEKTAEQIGGMNTGESVRKIVYRYLEKHPE